MAEIKDCTGKRVKISKNSITIKNEEGKTCGVVRNTISLYDIQANKQIVFYSELRKAGLHGKISLKDIIISDGKMYVFRNISEKLYHEKYGYFSDEEEKRAMEKEELYKQAEAAGFPVIECIYM